MNLLLMRHGEAVDSAGVLGDGARWLTGKGRQHTRGVAEHLTSHASPGTIWTSPLVRAVQTAEIVALTCEIGDEFEVVNDLANGDCDALLSRVAAFRGARPLLLVGTSRCSRLSRCTCWERRTGRASGNRPCARWTGTAGGTHASAGCCWPSNCVS